MGGFLRFEVKYVLIKIIFKIDLYPNMVKTYRVTIERIFLGKETYTVTNLRKIFPFCDVFRGIDACVGLSG